MMSFRRSGREIVITLPRRRTVIKITLVAALIILAVGGTVAFLIRPVELFRDIKTPFEINFAENIQEILLVYENGTLIRPTGIVGCPGDVSYGFRAFFDYPLLFHFHAYAPFYNPSAVYEPWRTVGYNAITFVLSLKNQSTIMVYIHPASEGVEYWGSENHYFHVRPGISLYLHNHPYFEWISFNSSSRVHAETQF